MTIWRENKKKQVSRVTCVQQSSEGLPDGFTSIMIITLIMKVKNSFQRSGPL